VSRSSDGHYPCQTVVQLLCCDVLTFVPCIFSRLSRVQTDIVAAFKLKFIILIFDEDNFADVVAAIYREYFFLQLICRT